MEVSPKKALTYLRRTIYNSQDVESTYRSIMNERLKKMWYIHTQRDSICHKRNEILSFAKHGWN
jgi:CTP:phosphocholine cytidylyltransferase-like protein